MTSKKRTTGKAMKNLKPKATQVKGGVTSPRDSASGLATGRRAHKP